jgi:hypothetical protein
MFRGRLRTDSSFGFAEVPQMQAFAPAQVPVAPRPTLNLAAAVDSTTAAAGAHQASTIVGTSAVRAQVAPSQYYQVWEQPAQQAQPGRHGAMYTTGQPMPAVIFPSTQISGGYCTMRATGTYVGGHAANSERAPKVVEAAASSNGKPRTTIMLHNLPDGLTRMMLVDLLDTEGFTGTYDFVYLPIAFDTMQGLNHAFVNMLCQADAERLWAHFEGFTRWAVPSSRACNVAWNDKQQGVEELIERYRNSPVMHPSVPEEWKPLIIRGGHPCTFPPPTQKIKLPKVFRRQGAGA